MSNALRKLLIFVIMGVSLTYLVYRCAFTLNLTTTYAVIASTLLLIAEAYGVFCVFLYCVQVWDPSEPPEQPILPDRTVDVFVPTYNEDVMILRATLEACVRMEYPHRTFLCDDGGTAQRLNDPDPEKSAKARARAEELKALCAELGVTYMTREKNEHAKAGNLNSALKQTDGEFVIILDADHVPEPHFITRLIGYFANQRLAYVQTPHAFYNFDSFQSQNDHNARKYWEEGALFYEVIQPGRNRWGCPIFAGSAAMFRRKALEEVGYIALETITEDMHTGLRINARGWTALAISERLVAGQAAPDITTFHSQRLRWGEGNLSIMFHDNPLTARGLTFAQRLCYLGSMIHWAGGVFKLVIYLSPILMMLTGIAPLSELTWTLGGITLGYLLVSTFGVRALGKGHGSIVNGEFFGMVNFWTQIKGTWRALFKRGEQSFVVTSKRGRQSDSAMRFAYPHLALAALSALALAWGWSRYAYGVSEDLVRPLLPSVWIVLHLLLIWMVVRRALWPKDQRYSYRHATTVGVQFAVPDGPRGCGVTADLSDCGVGFVSYTDVPIGARIAVRLIGGGENVELWGKVVRTERMGFDRTLGGAGYRVGVQLDDLAGPALDAVNRITYHYAVPRLYKEYARGNRRSPLTALVESVRRALFGRRAHPRRVVRVPAVIAGHETVTEDVTPVAVAALLPDAPPTGTEVPVTVRTPMGEATGTATVLRSSAQKIGARVYHRTVLMLRDPAGPGFAHVQRLNTGGALKPALNPDRREPKKVQTLGAKALGAFAALLLVALGTLAFPVAHSDELFMRDVARASGSATPEQAARLDEIYRRTLDDSYPNTDKLVLLMRALPKANRTDDCDPLIVTLANRDPNNADLRLALAATQDRKRDYAGAEGNYQALISEVRRGRLSLDQRAAVYLAAARNRINAGDVPAAAERFNAYVGLVADEGVRNEFAGVLITAGRHAEVPALYEGAAPDYRGRVLLMSALALSRQFDEAEAQGRAILAGNPDDPHAQLLIAELLAHRGQYDKAREVFERVVARPDVKPEVRIVLARLQLLRERYGDALAQCEAAIAVAGPTEDAARAFVDAAAGVKELDAKYRGTVARVYERPETARATDGVYLARLAFVLNRVKMTEPALALSDRAVALLPNDFAVAEQRYALLMDQDKTGDAASLMGKFRGDPKDGQRAREHVVSAHLKGANLPAAEDEARALRAAFPNDTKAMRRLADVLSWNRKYPEALALFEVLRAGAPNDPEVRVRIGQVNLWAGSAPVALAEFARVLESDLPDQDKLWPDFVAAAAALPAGTRLTDGQAKLLSRIGEQRSARDSTDPLFLARLGTAFVREGRAAEAKPFLDRAAALPAVPPAQRRELATVFFGAGRPVDTLKQYAGATGLTHDDHMLLTDAHAALKDFVSAERSCRAALLAQPSDTAERKLADVLSWGGKYDEALAAFRRLRVAKPNDTDLLVRTAETMIWSGSAPDALLLVAATLEMDADREALYPVYVYSAAAVKALSPVHLPLLEKVVAKIDASKWTDGTALARLAVVHHRLGKAETARALADRAVRAPGRAPSEAREIATHLGAMGRTAEAAALFEGRPLTTEDRSVLAELAASARDWANAERQFRAVLAATPNDPSPAVRLAEVLSLSARHEEARKIIEGVLTREPTSAAALVAAGDICLRANDAVAAAARFETALKVAPNHAQARAGFIDAASAAGPNLTPAQAKLAVSYADALATGPSVDPVSACRLAWVMVQQHEVPRADKLLDRAVAAVTKDTPATARRELAPVLALRERGRDAVRMLDGLTPEPGDSLLLAKVHASLNEFPAAVAACRAYLAAKPNEEAAEAQLADLLAWSGDHDDALALYTKLRAKNPTDARLQVRTAEAMWRVNRRAEAMDLFVKLLGDAPMADPAGARAAFVSAAFELDKFAPDVVAALSRVRPAVLESGDAVLMGRLAVALGRAGKPAEADALFDRAASVLKPDDHESRWLFAAALNLAGRRAEAGRTKPAGAPAGETARRVALFCAAAGDFRAATAVLDDALAGKPDDRSLARARGDVLSWGREHAAAVAQFKKLLEAGPDADLTVRLADAHLRAGEPEHALALLVPEVAKKPAGSKAVRVFVGAAGTAGALAPEAAGLVLRCFREVAFVAEPDEPVFAARVALALRAAGAPRDSEALLDRAAKDAPRDPRARRMLAGLLATAGRTDAAFKLFEGIDPEPADKLQLAYLHTARKDFAAGENAARAFLTANPGDPTGERALADILSWGGKHKEALAAFAQLVAARPSDAELAMRVAEARLAAGETEAAAAVFTRAVEERLAAAVPGKPAAPPGPLDARARAGFASALATLERPAPAQIELASKLAKALPEGDTDYLTAGRLAVALNRAKRTEEAAALADRVAKLNSKDPAVRRELAGLLIAVGKPRKAVAELETSDATPTDRLLLAKLQLELGELSAAETTARKLVADAPADHEAVLVLAEVLSAKKLYADAAKQFDLVLKAKPTDAAVRTRAAEAHLGAGSYGDAADRFLPLLANNPRADVVKNYFAALAAMGDKEKIAPEHKRAALLLGAAPAVKDETDAAHLVNLAWVHHRCEAPKECDALLTAAAALKPTNEAVRRNLSGVMEVRGRYRDALAALEGVQLDDDGRVRVAGLHLALVDTTAAEKELRAVLEKVPAHAKARRQLAEVHTARKETAKAVEVLEKLASEFPTDEPLAVRTADAQLANGNFDAALARFRALIGAEAGKANLWFGYVNAAASCKDLSAADGELALKIAERADGDKDKPAEFWSRLGWVLFRTKKPERAERLVERALALKPVDPDVRRELAGSASAMGRNRDALTLYEGIELTPTDKRRVAELSIAVRDFPRAERLLAELLRDNPIDLQLRQLNAHLLLWTKKHAEALKEFRALEREQPGNGDVLNGIALATLWGGDNEGARPLLQARLAADPQQQILWLPYLDSMKQAPRVTDAIRKAVIDIADRVDELKDPAPDLLGGVGVGLAKVGERDRAIETLKKAVKTNPTSKELLLKLADTLSAAGRFAEADELYKKLISLDAVGSIQK